MIPRKIYGSAGNLYGALEIADLRIGTGEGVHDGRSRAPGFFDGELCDTDGFRAVANIWIRRAREQVRVVVQYFESVGAFVDPLSEDRDLFFVPAALSVARRRSVSGVRGVGIFSLDRERPTSGLFIHALAFDDVSPVCSNVGNFIVRERGHEVLPF